MSAALTLTKIVLAAAVDDEGGNCVDTPKLVMTTTMIRPKTENLMGGMTLLVGREMLPTGRNRWWKRV